MQQINFTVNASRLTCWRKISPTPGTFMMPPKAMRRLASSAQFASVEEGVQEVKRWMAEIPSISVGWAPAILRSITKRR